MIFMSSPRDQANFEQATHAMDIVDAEERKINNSSDPLRQEPGENSGQSDVGEFLNTQINNEARASADSSMIKDQYH